MLLQMALLLDTNEQNRKRLRKQTCDCQGEGIVRELGMVMYTLLYLKWITNKDLLCVAHGTLLNVMWQPGLKGHLGEDGQMYMYG